MVSKLTVLIPVFDEINLIENFTKKLLHVFQNSSTKFIFIDDGSKDGSNQWLAKHLPIIYKDEIFELIVSRSNGSAAAKIIASISLSVSLNFKTPFT